MGERRMDDDSQDLQRRDLLPAVASVGEMVVEAEKRIRSSVTETPLEPVSELVPNLPVRLFFKLENLQETGSFKLRGATNKVLSLTPAQAKDGVIAASNGNHGLGGAAPAKRVGVAAEVYVSSHVSAAKAQRIEQHGARLQRRADNPLDAELASRAPAQRSS